MIYCSNCGTHNRDGSKFCNNCGERLVPSSVPAKAESSPSTANKGLALPIQSAEPPAASQEMPPQSDSPAAPPAADTAGEMDIPGWLKNLRAAAPGAEQAPAEPAAEQDTPAPPVTPHESEVPDWLARLRAEPLVEDEPAATPVVSEDAPDWIQKLGEQAPEEVTNEPKPSSEVPSWLEELRAAAPAQIASPAEEATSELSELSDEPPTAESQPVPATPDSAAAGEPVAQADLAHESATLDEPAVDQIASPAVAEQREEASESGTNVPDSAESGTSVPAPADESETSPESDTESELPDWLKEIGTQAGPSSEPQTTWPEEEPVHAQATPSEDTSLEPDEETVEAWEAQAQVLQEEQEQAPAEEGIPDWLRLAVSVDQDSQETAPVQEEEAPPSGAPDWQALAAHWRSEPVEMGGPLGGLRGVLPLARALNEPHDLPKKPAERTSGASVLEAILTEVPLDADAAPRKSRRGLALRPLIYLLLALAVVIPLLLPLGFAESLLSISNTPAAEFYDVIQALPANSTVLVAFDYDPSMSGEMDLLADAVVGNLVQRHIKIIAVSTLETGPQIAERILQKATSDAPDYVYGFQYLNLGYLPGHEVGLAQLAAAGFPANARDFARSQPPSAFPVVSNIKSLGDVSLVVEFAGSEEPLRMWLEQVQARAGVRVAAAVSAGVEPKARTYRDADQLVAVLSGLVGAARFEVLSNRPGRAVMSLAAQSVAVIVLVFLIVLGNLVYWVSRARGRAR